MIMTGGLRKLALTAHLTVSIGWLGTVVAFLALAIAGVTSQDTQVLRAACLLMGVVVSYVIVPLAAVSLLSGLVSALGTHWRLLRYYWVLVKLVLTVVAILVLLKQLPPIRSLAALAADSASALDVLRGESRRPLIHAVGGLAVLLVVQVLGVYKPWGKTGYGRGRHGHAAG
jgi:hypothetical protein